MNRSIASKSRTAEAMLLLSAARFLIKFVKLKLWIKALGHQGLAPAERIEKAIKYARHVNHAARFLPFEVICLPRAMALSFMLRRRSIPHDLVIATRPIGQRTERDRLHAWIECEGQIVIGSLPGPWLQVFRVGESRNKIN